MTRVLLSRTCGYIDRKLVSISVYWDKTAREVVYPPVEFITVNNVCSPHTLVNNILVDAWCEGSTRVEIRGVTDSAGNPANPPVKRIEYVNSSSCAVANPCDLKVEGVDIVVSGVNTEGQELYKATVRASGGSTKNYSLTQGFSFPINNTGIFNNLKAGSYTVYVSSTTTTTGFPPKLLSCNTSYAFEIKPSRRVKFFTQFKNTDNVDCRLEWLDTKHTGAPIELEAAADAVIINVNAIGNKLGRLQGSDLECMLNIHDANLVKQFHTPNDRELRVDYYEGGVLLWQGYHLTHWYSEPWVSTPFKISLSATDGIGHLQSIPYLDPNGNRYYGRARMVDVLLNCLTKLDLTIPLYLGVNVYETTMDPALEPLAQCEVDQSRYYDKDDKADTCKDVLEKLLLPGTFIIQATGALHVLYFPNLKGPYKRRKSQIAHPYTGFESEEEFEHNIRISRQGKETGEASFRNAAQVVGARPAVKYIRTITELGEFENLVLNGDFQDWIDDKTPLFWHVDGECVAQQQSPEALKFECAFTKFDYPYTGVIGNYIRSKETEKVVQSGNGFTLSFDYEGRITDIIDRPGMQWVVWPEFSIYNNQLTAVNVAEALFGTETVFISGSSTPPNLVKPPSGTERIDAMVALADGTYLYITGTPAPFNPQPPAIPEGMLLAMYLRYNRETDNFTFGSFSKLDYLRLLFQIQIGDYMLDGGVQRSNESPKSFYWRKTNQAPYQPEFYANGEISTDGSEITFKGKFEIHTASLNKPGKAQVTISIPELTRINTEGASFYIDNIKLTERKFTDLERHIVEGENEVKVWSEPMELILYHGSELPRTQALVTMLDGTPSKLWGEGYLLQELVVRDQMAQHSRHTFLLRGDVVGDVTPISVVREFDMLNRRFVVDGWVKNCHSGIISIEAQEVFGGANTPVPARAILNEDGTPMLTEGRDFFVME